MKTNEQRQQEAKAAQEKYQRQAQEAIVKIQAKIEAYAARAEKPGFNWAMAGDMAHIAGQLAEIAEAEA